VSLTAANLAGEWTEYARIYHKVGVQSGVLADTTAVAPADAYVFEFGVPDSTRVRRIQPSPGEAILDIQPSTVSWVIGQYSSYAIWLTATRMTLNDGHEEGHRFPGDPANAAAQVLRVFRRTPTQ
jgi:hypothetical protein